MFCNLNIILLYSGMSDSSNHRPAFFNLLSSKDQEKYIELQKKAANEENRYNRFRRLSTMREIFNAIRQFCETENEDKWKRYLVCGIFWYDDYVVINTRQLRILIAKCKSSINGALLKMGYETVHKKSIDFSFLTNYIPLLEKNHSDFRQWTIRKKIKEFNETHKTKKNATDSKSIIHNLCDSFSFDFELQSNDESYESIMENEERNNSGNDEIMQFYENYFY